MEDRVKCERKGCVNEVPRGKAKLFLDAYVKDHYFCSNECLMARLREISEEIRQNTERLYRRLGE